ncbi:MAG: C39 family peptidase [Oscillospiraceae bacterium]|nr:C39 family peptidase [Oscillospiraceae bacterium]
MNRNHVALCVISSLCCILSIFLFGCGEEIHPEESLATEKVSLAGTDNTTTTVTETTTTLTTIDWSFQTTEQNNGVLIQNVPHYTQFTSYKTACESLATVAMLRYFGIDMTPDEFLDGFLPIADYPQNGKDNQLHAESPWEYFIGDPMREDAFGCYNGAIVRALDKIKTGLGIALNNQSLDKICKNYIDKGQPVVLWATMYMANAKESFTWILPNDEEYTFITPEHALLLVGYDEKNYYFSDSLQYGETYGYRKDAVEKAYDAMSKQAVAIDQEVLACIPEFWKIPENEENEED